MSASVKIRSSYADFESEVHLAQHVCSQEDDGSSEEFQGTLRATKISRQRRVSRHAERNDDCSEEFQGTLCGLFAHSRHERALSMNADAKCVGKVKNEGSNQHVYPKMVSIHSPVRFEHFF